MLLLTWHGTIIRLEKDSGRLTHARLVPRRPQAADMLLELPPEGLAAPLAGPAGIMLSPGEAPGTVHMAQGAMFLSVGRGPFPLFNRGHAGPYETLLLVPEADVALLRDLLAHAWRRSDTGETVQAADIALTEGPVLQIGATRMDLRQTRPIFDAALPDTIVLPLETGPVALQRVAGSLSAPDEILVAPRKDGGPSQAASEAEFRAMPEAWLEVAAGRELQMPPILGSSEDRDFIYRREWKRLPPASGTRTFASRVVHERHKAVLLERSVEGIIMDANGVSNEWAYIGNLARREPPPHFSREGGATFIDRTLIEDAPLLTGPHVVFYGGNYPNYYHWLIDAMVPLSIMAPHLPPDATLLLPGSLAHFRAHPIGKLDYIAVLDAFGFGDMKRVEVPGQACRVEDVYWADRCVIEQVPAGALRTARDRALARRPAARGPGTRIYVRRKDSRSVANADAVESYLVRNDFVPVMMEDLTVTQQIDLFRQAGIVVAPHGAALANLMFCAPGTKVLELSPDCEYRAFFNEISVKLGLTHAVLPCPTDDGTFSGRMTVSGTRLNLLLNLLLSRRAA